jgi:hypothetical protein
MNTNYSPASVTVKAAAAVACAVITFALFNGVASLARPGDDQATTLAMAKAAPAVDRSTVAPVRVASLTHRSQTVR